MATSPIPDRLTDRPIRGFMLDTARCLEVRGYYRRFIDFVAERGVNLLLWHFTDDQGCSLRFDTVPEAASPNAYSKEELRALVQYARERGIEVVPELASLGHSRYLTVLPQYAHLSEASVDAHFSGMCPVSDEVRELIGKLIDETCEVFDSPNLHVGFDEVNIGGHPLTQKALETATKGDLFADYAIFLNERVQANGRRMWMWADCVLKHPEMVQRIPRDVVMCDWQYTPEVSPQTTQTLLDSGFDVLSCSALISHDQPLFPGEQFAVPNVRVMQNMTALTGRGRVIGHVNTIWTPVRFIADSLWLGIDLATAILREGAAVDAKTAVQQFASDFYGLPENDASQFADIGQTLFNHAPLRDEWLDVIKLQIAGKAELAAVTALADEWTAIQRVLAELSVKVQKHRTEFEAFQLLIDLLVHTYDAAARAGDYDASARTDLLNRGREVASRTTAAWDRERFADDPRKRVAPVPSFQDDHLIPLIDSGLLRLASHRLVAKKSDASVPKRTEVDYDTPAEPALAAAGLRTTRR